MKYIYLFELNIRFYFVVFVTVTTTWWSGGEINKHTNEVKHQAKHLNKIFKVSRTFEYDFATKFYDFRIFAYFSSVLVGFLLESWHFSRVATDI